MQPYETGPWMILITVSCERKGPLRLIHDLFSLSLSLVFRSDESRSARALAYGAKLGNVATGGNVGGGGGGGGGSAGIESGRHKMLRGSLDGHSAGGNMDEDEKAAADVSECFEPFTKNLNFFSA
jgi:hypothetical protein